MKRIIFIILIISLLSCQHSTKNILGSDIRLFRDTPIWELAQAAKSQDTVKMKKIIKKAKFDIDYQEPKFGNTLLMIAVYRQWISSVKVLLEAGSDPNLPDNYDSENAVIEACGWGPDWEDNPELLRLVLQYGGDPNYVAVPKRKDNQVIKTPLKVAAGCSLAKTKILVEAGADINYITNEYGSAVNMAAAGLSPESPYILKYLLDNGGDCSAVYCITIDDDTLSLVSGLRDWRYPLDSEEYKVKMEIVEMLKACGQDYWSTPIPKRYYKLYDKEYLEKY